MFVSQLYQQYPVPLNLAEHMFWVAGVGTWIAQHFQSKIDQKLITKSLLLHDLANLIKFDLAKFSYFLKPEDHDLQYWQAQQQVMIARYGDREHLALLALLKELNVDAKTYQLLDQLSIYNLPAIVEGTDFPLKICLYADYRVAPAGLVSLETRLADLKNRYHQREPNLASQKKAAKNLTLLKQLETQIETNLDLSLTKMTQEQVFNLLKKLKDFELG